MLQELTKHFPDSSSYTQGTYFIGYIDPGLGYTFQNLGPIIPTILGAITGAIALFGGRIRLIWHKLTTKKEQKEDTQIE